MLKINGSARTPGAIELLPATITSLELDPPTEASLLAAKAVGIEIGQRLVEDEGEFEPVSVLNEIGLRYPRFPLGTFMELAKSVGDSMEEHLARGPVQRILARDMRSSFNALKGFAMAANDHGSEGESRV